MPELSDVIEITQKLIAFPAINPPGDVREITDFVEAECRAWGLSPERVGGKADKPNLRMQMGTGSGPTLVYYGHTDVVPVSTLERTRWNSDPFQGTIRGDRLYGRGAVDSKGTLASMLVAARELAKVKDQMQGTLIFWVVADGEVGDQDGLKWLDDQGKLAGDMVIGCEPSQMKIVRAYKGRAWLDINIRGRSRHSLTPNANDSAIMAAVRVLNALARYPVVPAGVPEILPEILGGASITATQVHAGEAYNVSPGESRVTVDLRMMPGDSSQAALARFDAFLGTVELDGWSVSTEIIPGSIREPLILDDDANIVQVMQAALSASGLEPNFGQGYSSGGVGNFLQKGIPGVYYGPGTIEDAHGANESASLADLRKTAEVYYNAGLAATKVSRR